MARLSSLTDATAPGRCAPSVADTPAPPSGAAPNSDPLLSTAEAAAMMGVSRPYVAMLCEEGKLGEIIMTEGRHSSVRASAVKAYLAGRTRSSEEVLGVRQAGLDAGLHDHADDKFVKAGRRAAIK